MIGLYEFIQLTTYQQPQMVLNKLNSVMEKFEVKDELSFGSELKDHITQVFSLIAITWASYGVMYLTKQF